MAWFEHRSVGNLCEGGQHRLTRWSMGCGRNESMIRSVKSRYTFLVWFMGFGLFCGTQLEAGGSSNPNNVSDPPQVRSPVSLKAINDPQTGKAAFSFMGREDPPVIRARPGEDIRLTYTNAMSTPST